MISNIKDTISYYFNTFFCSLFIYFSIIVLSSCTNIHHGYKFEKDDDLTIQKMVENKVTISEIVNKFGSPTFINNPINDTICYIGGDGKRMALSRFYKPTYHYVCIVFENGRAKALQNKTIEKINKEKMVNYDISFEKPL